MEIFGWKLEEAEEENPLEEVVLLALSGEKILTRWVVDEKNKTVYFWCEKELSDLEKAYCVGAYFGEQL